MRLATGVRFIISFLFAASSLGQGQACNNSPALCDKRYNEITHLGAHDSPFVRNVSNGFDIAGDQFYGSLQQLDAGARLLTAQIHKVTESSGNVAYHLCHTSCDLYDAGLLGDWLNGIKGWLDSNSNDVVTILLVNSDNADAPTLGGIFSASEIEHYAYQPPDTTEALSSWPSLMTLIDSGKRLVVFIASLDPTTNTSARYLLDEFTFVFENQYDVDSPSDFSCTANRPASLNGKTAEALSSGRLPLMNHFLYDNISGIEIPSVENADNTNAASGSTGNLGAAAKSCTSAYGKSPTFILVDFFNVGPAIATVDMLNNVTGTTSGRMPLPTTVLGSGYALNSTSTESSSKSSSFSSPSSSSSPTSPTPSPSPGASNNAAIVGTLASSAFGLAFIVIYLLR